LAERRLRADQIIGEPSLPAGAGFALHSIDEIDDGVKAAARTTADARSRNGDRQMRFAGAGSADQYDIALFGKEGAACQIADRRFVDRRVGEVEVVDVFGQRQLGNRQLILIERACFSAISALSRSPTMRAGSCRCLMPVVITSS
jgi:hypothetical protein